MLWCLSRLPYRLAIKLGEGFGALAYPLARSRRHIVAVNLKLCFPELDAAERRQLARRNFRYTGRTVVEMALAWWGSEEKLKPLGRLHGVENLERAIARGKGVLLAGCHFTTLEIAARLFAMHYPFDLIYRPNDNPVFEYLTQRNRRRHFGEPIAKDDVRSLIRSLRAGRRVWYPPDQDYGKRVSVFAPFFGIQAATLAATPKLAQMTGAAVVPSFFYGRDDGSGYDIYFEPALDNFPSEDPIADVTRLNQVFETAIRRAPAQYLWVHRRFKRRPNPNDPDLYA